MANPIYYSKVDRRRTKKTHTFAWTLLLLFFFALIAGGYFAWQRYQEGIRYYFLSDRYKKINGELQQVLPQVGNPKQKKIVAAFEKKINKLIVDFPDDGYLFLTRGLLYKEMTLYNVHQNRTIYWDVFFSDYLDRFTFPPQVNRKNWYLAIISLRKALRLQMNKEQMQLAYNALAALYLFGGKAYAHSGMEICQTEKQACGDFIHFYRLLLKDKIPPDWITLQKKFDPSAVRLWQAIYLLKTGNSPAAFTMLSGIAENPTNLSIRNNALYLMSQIMTKQKKLKQQIYYQEKIDLQEFLPRQKWFLEEYVYNLRFIGLRGKAQTIETEGKKILGK